MCLLYTFGDCDPTVREKTNIYQDHLAISRVHVGDIITSWGTPNGKSMKIMKGFLYMFV